MATEQKNNKAANKWNIPSDWEVKRLGDFIEKIVGGGTPSREKLDYWNGKINWATVKDFSNFNPNKTQETITEEGLKKSASNLIPKYTLIIATRMALGKVVKFNIDVAINQDLKAIFPKSELDSNFLFYWFINNTSVIEGLGNGSTVKGVTLDDLKGITFFQIPIPEQKAIAKVLSTMDELIQKNQQLIAQKEQRKKWLMQQLLTGKKRLKGFSGEWKECTLGEFIVESRIPSKENNPDNRITVKLNLNGIEKRAVRGTEMDDATSYFIRKAGQFIYGKQNLHKGAFGIIPFELDGFESSQDIPTFDFQENIVPTFFLYYVSQENFYTGLEKISTGTGSKRIHPEELYKVKVIFPLVEEQTAIAQVLKAADKEINILKTKAEKLKEQKKGLMQVLLTGKKRLRVE